MLLEKIENAVLIEIAAGKHKDGDKLPTLLDHAKLRGCSPGTMQNVLQSLHNLEVIDSKQGGRYRVKEGGSVLARREIKDRITKQEVEILHMAESANVSCAVNYTERG